MLFPYLLNLIYLRSIFWLLLVKDWVFFESSVLTYLRQESNNLEVLLQFPLRIDYRNPNHLSIPLLVLATLFVVFVNFKSCFSEGRLSSIG